MSPQPAQPTLPYWRLSGFYFFYFATIGGLVPYWGLYLQHLGFKPAAVGELLAIVAGTKIIAPNLWGWLADRLDRRMRIVRLASLCAMLSFCGVFFGSSYVWLALNMMLFSFFWNAALPQFEVNTLNWLGPRVAGYSLIRLWGSIGFILLALGLGPVLDAAGAGQLPVFLALMFVGIWIAALSVPEGPARAKPADDPRFLQLLRQPAVLSLFAVCFLAQFSHGAYYAFYSIYLQDAGYSKSLIGQLWALGVVAEILVFLAMRRLLPRIGARRLMLIALGLTALRWAVIASAVDHVPLLAFAQLLHAASFGVYHAVAIDLVHRWFAGSSQGRGQALYSSLSFGAGGALGSLIAGYLWGALGGSGTYWVFAAIALLAWMVGWFGLRRLPG